MSLLGVSDRSIFIQVQILYAKNYWLQSVHGRTPLCLRGRIGSLPIGAAKIMVRKVNGEWALVPTHWTTRDTSPATYSIKLPRAAIFYT